MLEMRPDCERCGADLPAHVQGAFICSYECTFCADCAETLDDRCASCGGDLTDRPTRSKARLIAHPASTVLKFRS
ncbi:MAG: DUF1272 domain-containing protein [Pseudomonadota bacterium]|nr:DUF1272 domain-containing protein [Pseudomonadota bacterium]